MADLTLPIQLDPASPPDATLHVTASGLPVRIYATDCGGSHPIHGAFFHDGKWWPLSWGDNGSRMDIASAFDLRDRPPVKRGVWVAWFADDDGNNFLRSYATQAEAETAEHKWATLRGVTYLAEGDGLDTPADPPLVVDWAKLPEWAEWAAADENGQAHAYEIEPRDEQNCWDTNHRWTPLLPDQYRLAPGFDWRKTLTQRPEAG